MPAGLQSERNSIGGDSSSTDHSTEVVGETLSNQDSNTDEQVRSLRPQASGIDCAFYVRRLSVPFGIIALSTVFPNVNFILSLFGGSICGVCFIVMPVLFYRQAFLVVRPSKKDRRVQLCLGYMILAVALPVGILGVYANLKTMIETDSGISEA